MQYAWENEYSFQNQQKKTYFNSMTNLLIELSNLFFFILIIYALVELGNEEKFHFKEKCGEEGSSFLTWMIIRLCLGIIQFFVILFVVMVLKLLSGMNSFYLLMGGFLLISMYVVTFSLGIYYTKTVMDKSICRDVMTEASFTKSPLLGILGWIYVALDGLILVTFIFYMTSSLCFAGTAYLMNEYNY
jgi:hypothetical protein